MSGWSRRERRVAGFATFAGAAGLPQLLAAQRNPRLPAAADRRDAGILYARTFAALPAGAGLVNAGRGGHLVEEDLIPALDSGQLSAAVLDVFREEPLPPGHPFWRHPRIIVTPHIAGMTNPATAAPIIRDSIRALRGRPPARQPDRPGDRVLTAIPAPLRQTATNGRLLRACGALHPPCGLA